ncbi:MAG TPA: hypothetical protein VHY91_12195 [Pirellulales bacterium]|jgi:hypothetical protein|nr:hypothetical protein [Pirellulales bacterium]
MKTVILCLLLASAAQAQSPYDKPASEKPASEKPASEKVAAERSRRERVIERAARRAAQRRQSAIQPSVESESWGMPNQSFSASNPGGTQMRSVYTCSPVPGMGSFGQ